MSPSMRWWCVAALIASATVSVAAQNRGTIVSHIEYYGNRRMSSEAIRAFIFTRPGDPYLGQDALERDVIALRNTNNFTSVRVEVKDDPNRASAKIVIFHFIERPAEPKNNSQ